MVRLAAARMAGARKLTVRMLGARELAAQVAAGGLAPVLVVRQEWQSGPEGHHARQRKVRLLGEDLDLVDAQGDAEFTAPGVETSEPGLR